MSETRATRTRRKLDQLEAMFADRRSLLVLLQDYPDPDALASAAAMRALAHHFGAIPTTVASGGVVGRAENRALMRYLRLPYHILDEVNIERFDCVALVDTQPRTGNNSLPHDLIPDIVVDHHPLRDYTKKHVPLYDVRKAYGAASTILHEYLVAADVRIDTQLATSLVYGIRSDTHDLGRDACKADIEAMTALYPLANHRMLSEIQASKTPRPYFAMLYRALQNARVYGDCVVSNVGSIQTPDIVGEIADLLLRDEDCAWSLCYGAYEQQVLLSLRTSDRRAEAGVVMGRLVDGLGTGGGHRTMAGGQIRCADGSIETALAEVERRIHGTLLDALAIDTKVANPLLDITEK